MKTLVFMCWFLMAAAFLQAQIIQVPADQPSIQYGINAAADGDTVLVAEGTYLENVNFMGKAITVASHFIMDGDTNHISNTIINGSYPANPDFASVVTFMTGEDTTSVLCGFTITGGTGMTHPAAGARVGGGIVCYNAGATIIDNKIIGNVLTSTSALGGGIYIYNPAVRSVISKNIISNNIANWDWPSQSFGGGIYMEGVYPQAPESNPVIEKNHITVNTAYIGGGISCVTMGVNMINNFISGNDANWAGGAIYFSGSPYTNNVTELINNTITNNGAYARGGRAGGICFSGDMNFMLMNDIIYGNWAEMAGDIGIYSGNVQLNNCDIDTDQISGSWTGDNNFFADPEFIDEMAWDCWNHDAPCSETGIEAVFAFDRWFEAPVEDILNNIRPQDESFDVGAVEVNLCFVGYPEAVGGQRSVVNNYPNPFSISTTFKYEIKEPSSVTLKIFNNIGQEVNTLVNEQQSKGFHQVDWDAEGLPSGIYFYRLTAGSQPSKGKIVVVK